MDIKTLLKENLQIIKNTPLSDEQKVELLDLSLLKGKNPVATYFLEQGVLPYNTFALDAVAEKKNNVKMLKLFHDKGIDLTQRGNIMFFKAAFSQRIENFDYLFNFIEHGDRVIKIVLLNIANKVHHDSIAEINQLERTKQRTPLKVSAILEKNLQPLKYILMKTLEKSTKEQRDEYIVDNLYPELKIILDALKLEHVLESAKKNQPQVANPKKRIKI